MSGSACVISRGAADDWQSDGEYGACCSVRLDPEAAAMRFDDLPRDREPHPHARRLRRCEQLEQTIRDIGCDPGSSIPDADRHHVSGARGLDLKLAAIDVVHGLDGIAYRGKPAAIGTR